MRKDRGRQRETERVMKRDTGGTQMKMSCKPMKDIKKQQLVSDFKIF